MSTVYWGVSIVNTEQHWFTDVDEKFSIWFWVGTDASFSFRKELTFYIIGTQYCQINKISNFIISWNTLAHNFPPITVILAELALLWVWNFMASQANLVHNQHCLQSIAEFFLNPCVMEQWKPQVFPCSHKSFLTPDAEISGIGEDIRTLASRKA